MKISNIRLNIIPDSKGKDTLEASMVSEGVRILASVPAGESTGKNEAKLIESKKAVEKVPWVFSQIRDHNFASLEQFDQMLQTLDGTGDKSNLGANLILSLSISFTKLLAKKGEMEVWQLISKISGSKPSLPLCFFNLIEGGVHTENSLPFQEHWFIPKTQSPQESLHQVLIFIKALGEKIQIKYEELKQGSEGGYAVPSSDPRDGLKILREVLKEQNMDADLGLDVAASTFYKDGNYQVGDKLMDKDELLNLYKETVEQYPILAIEDPFAEEDWEGFKNINQTLGDKIWVIGDDLTTTNSKVIKKAAEENVINAVIIKTTQIGTVTETIQAANLAKNYGFKRIVSNRGEETMDSFIADLSVGLGAEAIKSGCPLRQERLVKYQKLVEIERSM